jgi:hypothetical protein
MKVSRIVQVSHQAAEHVDISEDPALVIDLENLPFLFNNAPLWEMKLTNAIRVALNPSFDDHP